jgi:putative sigma-54 modulation protein
MQINVTFRHMDANDGMKEYARQKLLKMKKYVESPVEAYVVLSVEKFRNIAEVTIKGEGVSINGEERSDDMYSAIDNVMDKIGRQIKKRRGKNRRYKAGQVAPSE